MDNTIIALLILFAGSVFWSLKTRSCRRREPFTEVISAAVGQVTESSLQHCVEPKIKYEKAFYYELDNNRFLKGLQRALAVMPSSRLKEAEWKKVNADAQYIIDKYKVAFEAFQKAITSGTNAGYFSLPDGTSPKFQIVYDNIQYAYEKGTDVMIVYDVVLYREGKAHGKHIIVTSIVRTDIDKTVTVEYAKIKVLGIVSADTIGLFPVRPMSFEDPPYETVANMTTKA